MVNYSTSFNKKDLEPEIVTELENLDKHLCDVVGRKYPDIWLFTGENEDDALHRTFRSKVGLLMVSCFGAGHPKYGDRAVKRLRRKLSKKYPEMEQPKATRLETSYKDLK